MTARPVSRCYSAISAPQSSATARPRRLGAHFLRRVNAQIPGASLSEANPALIPAARRAAESVQESTRRGATKRLQEACGYRRQADAGGESAKRAAASGSWSRNS